MNTHITVFCFDTLDNLIAEYKDRVTEESLQEMLPKMVYYFRESDPRIVKIEVDINFQQ